MEYGEGREYFHDEVCMCERLHTDFSCAIGRLAGRIPIARSDGKRRQNVKDAIVGASVENIGQGRDRTAAAFVRAARSPERMRFSTETKDAAGTVLSDAQ
jgi:hypothetical protein